MTRIRNRAALIALPLALGALAVGSASAAANSYNWGDNGSGTCSYIEGKWDPSQEGAELGTYCMQSVTGWISIGGGATQAQAISCSNNDSSSGLSYSTDGQAYDNAGPWYAMAVSTYGGEDYSDEVGWQTGDGGDADLSGGDWNYYGSVDYGSNANAQYGSGGAVVTNWGGSGGWQTALACVNAAGDAATASNPGSLASRYTSRRLGRPFADVARASARVRVRDRTIDSMDKAKGKALLAREYVVKKNVSRTDTRTCPAGMVRKGKLAYTVQEFPANNKFSWKNRSLVDVKMTNKGKNAGSVKMTLKRAKSPTVVQFQLRCVKR